MSEYTKQYKFTHDTRFDFNTSYTKDDSIRYLMGDLQGQLREDTQEDTQRAEYPDDFSELSFCEILENELESAQTSYVNAKALRKMFQRGMQDADDEEVTDEQFAELERKLNSAAGDMAKYHEYLCDIVDELAKGSQSELRIDQNNTKNIAYPYITLSSLKAWAKIKYPDTETAPPKKTPRIKMRQQQDAVLAAIRKAGYDPARLPKQEPGKPWVKAEVWDILENNPLFEKRKAFDNAWSAAIKISK